MASTSKDQLPNPDRTTKEAWALLQGLRIVTELGDNVIEGKIAAMEERDKEAMRELEVRRCQG
ncbi:hypothetical protein Ancab_007603, partial [Ancistrocladus abbreviatus]